MNQGRRNRGPNGRGIRQQQRYTPQGVGFTRLKEWAALISDPDQLLLQVTSNLEELRLLLNSGNLNNDKLSLLMDIMDIALKANGHSNSFVRYLDVLVQTQLFTGHAHIYLNTKRRNVRLANTIMAYINEAIIRTPSSVDDCLSTVNFLYQNCYQFNVDHDTARRLVTNFDSRHSSKSVRTKALFTDIPIYPTSQDLTDNSKTILPENKIGQAFTNKYEYLDTMYRLLREDYMRPLRETLTKARAGKLCNSDVVLFQDVKFLGAVVKGGIEYLFQISSLQIKCLDLKSKSQFMSGNLVCISEDNFRTVHFAMVANNTPSNFVKGIIRLHGMHGTIKPLFFPSEINLKLVESPSFFEAYCHVLEGLKEWCDIKLPLESYLVQCKNLSAKPAYLSTHADYDVSCLMKATCSRSGCRIFKDDSWPHASSVCLNKEQFLAVKEAITKELTLIQGPPGTGKTFVSFKIMRVLLENLNTVSPDCGPILVVCFTNHALDQFLEGVLEFCPEGIIRVGGGSKCPTLESHNLSVLRNNNKSQTKIFGKALFNIHRAMEPLEKEITKRMRSLKLASKTVYEETNLSVFMMHSHRESFRHIKRGKSAIKIWLGIDESSYENSLQPTAEAHLISLLMKENSTRSENCLRFNGKIPVATKAMVYRKWVNAYEKRYGRVSKETVLADEELRTIVPDNIMREIYTSGYDSVKDWLLGNDMEEIVSNIESLISDCTTWDQDDLSDSDVYDDDSCSSFYKDDQEVDDLDDNERVASLLQRMQQLKINLTITSQTVRSSSRQISYSEAVLKLESSPQMSAREEEIITDIWILSWEERFKLYKSWHTKYTQSLTDELNQLIQKYNCLLEEKKEIQRMRDISLLKRTKVIGMTTTGAAKHRKLLKALGPKIVVVEEAAEVLEAHIITSLSPHCQHLILIGDHQQLRPKTEVYELAQFYHLDISLFERLVENKFRCIQLKEQFRMRPEISVFIKHIYPDLKDGASVHDRENIKGMDKNVFFIKHNQKEDKIKKGSSKLNSHEAKYVVKLAEYLISQGHLPGEITILAAYGGQVTLLQDLKTASKDQLLQEVRISTIDNFQGEENKIILLSLVRSNCEQKVGFLSTNNRVCVALSRAKFGMYVIGDLDLLSRQSQLWANIKSTAEERGCIGGVLNLSCQQHGNFTAIRRVIDFDAAIQLKGCGHPCLKELTCGHECSLICHVGNHDEYVCKKKCMRLCPRAHLCRKLCSQPCPPCKQLVWFTLPCGHFQQQVCATQAKDLICWEKCERKCPNGHQCPHECKRKCPPCSVFAERILTCGHTATVLCHVRHVECKKACEKVCSRGHPCSLLCGQLCEPCGKYVTMELECGHWLIKKCWKFASQAMKCKYPCRKVCTRGHACPDLCHKPCSHCDTRLSCGHYCNELYTPHPEISEEMPCVQMCFNRCGNGHPCPKKCSDLCPSRCDTVLKCGHVCQRVFVSPLASIGCQIVCDEPCQKLCTRGHPCFSSCSKPCLPCGETLPCGHRCGCTPMSHVALSYPDPCVQQCRKVCRRGHQCPAICRVPCPATCRHWECKVLKIFTSGSSGFKDIIEWKH